MDTIDKIDALIDITKNNNKATVDDTSHDTLIDKDSLRCPICSNIGATYEQDVDCYDNRALHILSCTRCGTVVTNDILSRTLFINAVQYGIAPALGKLKKLTN